VPLKNEADMIIIHSTCYEVIVEQESIQTTYLCLV